MLPQATVELCEKIDEMGPEKCSPNRNYVYFTYVTV